jgi:hypothetical protein
MTKSDVEEVAEYGDFPQACLVKPTGPQIRVSSDTTRRPPTTR